MPLKLVWEERALRQLDQVTHTAKQAQAVIEAMERMARVGWSLGRPTRLEPRLRYWPVSPFGVFYLIRGQELRVRRVVDARRLRQLP